MQGGHMPLDPITKRNLLHPMTWIAFGGILFWLLLMVQALFGNL
jgi:hypothetical protein